MQDKRVKTKTSKPDHKEESDCDHDDRKFRRKYERRCDKMLKAFLKGGASGFSRSHRKLQSLIFSLQTKALDGKKPSEAKPKQATPKPRADSDNLAAEIDRQIFLAQKRRLDFDEINMKDDNGDASGQARKGKAPRANIALKSCQFCMDNNLISSNRIIFESDSFVLIVPDRCLLIRQSKIRPFSDNPAKPHTFDSGTAENRLSAYQRV